MNMLTTFAEMTWQEAETVQLAAETYMWLYIAIPVMLAFMLIILFLINVAIFGVSDRLTAIKELLEDVFEDKLDEKYELDRLHREESSTAKKSAHEERKSVSDSMSRNRKIFIGTLAASIPVLALILVIIIFISM